MTEGRKQVNLDGEIGKLLATYSARRGVRQQHALSAATLFYLATGDQVRGIIDYIYSCWTNGEDFTFVNEDWVTSNTTTPWLQGEHADSYIRLMSIITARTTHLRQLAREAREFLEDGKKPPWLFELDPDRDAIEQLIEHGAISEQRVPKDSHKRPASTKKATPRKKPRKKPTP